MQILLANAKIMFDKADRKPIEEMVEPPEYYTKY